MRPPALCHHPGAKLELTRPTALPAAYDDGRVELLLSLTGVVPVPVGASTYHCPVRLWLPLDFPSRPPIVYVVPSETLAVRKGRSVDASGKVGVPYLDNWERKSEVRRAALLLLLSLSARSKR